MSIQRASPCSASRWAAAPRSTPSIATWARNISPSGFAPRSSITPAAASPVRTTAPTLILIGDKDDWTPADRCRDMVTRARSDGSPITLHVYPGVHHAFDVAQLQPGIRNPLGHWLEYDKPAAQDAEQKVRAFLARHLARAASVLPAAK